ncbi:MAG: Xaa-Pro peptidase family protein [Actinomycetota bacterium]|nr:Xaa-Pro peptidase family protein [Actinomycetota bacterium]HZY64945.1 Xaa-Pro peptidase family protein [Rubrobacteraceae bacterium]
MNTEEYQDLLVIGAPEHDPTAYYLSGFLAPDPVIFAQVSGRKYLAVSTLEYGRAQKQDGIDKLFSFEELEVNRLARELKSGSRAYAAAAAGLLESLGVDSVAVPPGLGVIYADELRDRGIEISPEPKLFAEMRRVKTEEEISYIEKTQRAVEAACARAVEVVRESKTREYGNLHYNDRPLTSEFLRSEIEIELLRHGCTADAGTITAGGSQSADPHEQGHGPLRTSEPIILDIFPVSKESRYYADMTRTIIKGEPDEELQKMYDGVLESQEAALAMIRAGVNGKEVHQKVSDILHERGYKTIVHDQQKGQTLTEGFIHGTGHGVGLEIHEGPRIGLTDEELKAGDVVTVEPGLYDPRVGGVRIEDLVVVTEDGCRNLTEFPKILRI